MYPIGTIVTYNKTRWKIIGYKPHITTQWYKIQPIEGGRYNTCSGKYFTEITEPVGSWYPLGTEVTCNNKRWTVIGYTFVRTGRMYKIQPHDGGKWILCAAEHLSNVVQPVVQPTPAPTPARPTPPPVDPCKTIVCPAKCFGVDKYGQTCLNGVCVQATLHESNSPDCGYEPPSPKPTPAPTPAPYPTPTPDPMPPRPTPTPPTPSPTPPTPVVEDATKYLILIAVVVAYVLFR